MGAPAFIVQTHESIYAGEERFSAPENAEPKGLRFSAGRFLAPWIVIFWRTQREISHPDGEFETTAEANCRQLEGYPPAFKRRETMIE